jgi:hypothetical protein
VSVSQRLTAKAERDRCADVLAATARRVVRDASAEHLAALHEALVEFTKARGV